MQHLQLVSASSSIPPFQSLPNDGDDDYDDVDRGCLNIGLEHDFKKLCKSGWAESPIKWVGPKSPTHIMWPWATHIKSIF